MSPPRATTAPLLLAVLLLCPAPRAGESLARIVPADAYSLSYSADNPDFDFLRQHSLGVLEAVKNAGFDELILQVFADSHMPAEKVTQFRGIRDLFAGLLGGIEWDKLMAGEVVYAESSRPALPLPVPAGPGSLILGCRVERADVAGLERSLQSLLQVTAGMLPQALTFEARTTDESGARSATRLYELHLRSLPVIMMAVRDDVILFGLGKPFFSDTLACLEGQQGRSLVDSERFRMAFEGVPLPENATFMYMDVRSMVDGVRDQLILSDVLDRAPAFLPRLLDEVADLAHCFDTVAVVTRAEGTTTTVESWTRFRPDEVRAGNPLYLAIVGEGDASGLLDFVPAEALSFHVSPARDFGPLYHWVRQRLPECVPEAEQGLAVFDLAQAVLGLEIERDVLSCVGSSSVTITLPSQRPGVPEERVSIVQLKDKEAGRRLLERAEGIWTVFQERILGGPLGDEIRRSGAMLPEIEISDVPGGLPGLKNMRVSFQMPVPLPIPMPEVTYGFVGNLFVTTTSPGALQYVLDTAAGEHPGLADHPALQLPGRQPDGPVLSGSLTPYARQIEQVRQVVGAVGGSLQLIATQVARKGGERHEWLPNLIAGITRGTVEILASLAFLQDGVAWREMRHEGTVLYSRSVNRYTAPPLASR